MKFPFARPAPPRLSTCLDALREIENSGHYTNFGPKVLDLEARMEEWFSLHPCGSCLTVCNATIGLIIAVRETLDRVYGGIDCSLRRFAIVPSFTFPATAHSLLWNNLSPLLCDIDAQTWLPSSDSIERLKFFARSLLFS